MRVALVLVALAAPVADAVAAPPGELDGGLRAGLVLSSLIGDGVDASPGVTSTKAGPTAAGVVRWRLGEWSIEGELGFSDRGADFAPAGGDATPLHLYYLDVPVLGAYRFTVDGPIQPRLSGGLCASVLVSVRQAPSPVVLDNRFDLGLVLGAGAELAAGGGTVLIDLRYLGGGRNLNELDATEAQARGQAAVLSAAYVY